MFEHKICHHSVLSSLAALAEFWQKKMSNKVDYSLMLKFNKRMVDLVFFCKRAARW